MLVPAARFIRQPSSTGRSLEHADQALGYPLHLTSRSGDRAFGRTGRPKHRSHRPCPQRRTVVLPPVPARRQGARSRPPSRQAAEQGVLGDVRRARPDRLHRPAPRANIHGRVRGRSEQPLACRSYRRRSALRHQASGRPSAVFPLSPRLSRRQAQATIRGALLGLGKRAAGLLQHLGEQGREIVHLDLLLECRGHVGADARRAPTLHGPPCARGDTRRQTDRDLRSSHTVSMIA